MRWHYVTRVGCAMALVLAGQACAHAAQSATTSALIASQQRTLGPPPDWIFQRANWATAPGLISLPFLRGIVMVEFRPSASLAERRAAVDSVNGIILGQQASNSGEPLLFIRIPDLPTDGSLLEVVDRLQRNSAISLAEVDMIVGK